MDTNNPNTSPSGGNKKIVWIVLAVVVLGLIAYFATQARRGQNTTEEKSNTGQNQAATQSSASKSQSLKELMASGVSQKCEFSYKNGNSESQGSVFMAKGKMRGDFTSKMDGKETSSHMINDGQTFYTWVDGQGTGFKMSASAAMNSAPTQDSTAQQNLDPDAKYDYNCSQRTVSESEFAVPTSVTFTDMSAMMQSGAGASGGASGSGSASMKAQQCAACGSLSGDQKAQCLTALQCP